MIKKTASPENIHQNVKNFETARHLHSVSKAQNNWPEQMETKSSLENDSGVESESKLPFLIKVQK